MIDEKKYKEMMDEDKWEKKKMKSAQKQGVFIFLGIVIMILFIASIVLYFNGIHRTLAMIFFLVLPIASALGILFLSKSVWESHLRRKKKPAIKINV